MKSAEINDVSRRLLPIVVGVLVFLLIVYFWITSIKFVPQIADNFFPAVNNKTPTYGEVGEMFGAVSALFSGLTTFFVIILFWRQRTDKKQQQVELKQTKIDFEINRINHLIINQINRIDHLIETLSFQDGELNEYEGTFGIDFFNSVLHRDKINRFKNGEAVGQQEEELVFQNFSSLKKLLVVIAQSNQTIEDQIKISKIENGSREQLYAIFLRNLGASLLVMMRKLEAFTTVIINNVEGYQHTSLCFENPIFIISELSADFFHKVEKNCQGELIERIIPEPMV